MRNGRISVVIPFFNAEKTLPMCINAIETQSLKPLQVILVDNNSNDDSSRTAQEAVLRNPKLFTYMLESRQGPSFARNAGGSLASGDFIAFTDSDCVPDRLWLHTVLSAFDELQVGAVAGRISSLKSKSFLDKFHTMFTMQGGSENRTYTEFTLVEGGFPTANLTVRSNLFRQIKGFDEKMKIYSEDFDLCARIYKAGFKIRYNKNALVYHQHRNTTKGTWNQAFGFGFGHATLLKAHFTKILLLSILRKRIISRYLPFRVWIDLSGADKKLGLIVFISLLCWPMLVLLPLYILLMYSDIWLRLKKNNLEASRSEILLFIFFLFFKSAAITSGRLVGSLCNRVFCF